jgi:hypothetical protein
LTIRIPVESIDDALIGRLMNMCESNPGEHALKMKVMEEKIAMDFNVSAFKVDVNSAFIEEIRDMGLSYKLN